ncbi:MAG: putative stress-responsive transcriptional regulator [Candidatus Doudnabacteria bacterium]|nr:putative stress-responsive transcriptional regulator [Candidatus Doudnabacteria bacterium]
MTNKKLHLSHEHRVIAGVCGGLAEYFETDPVLIRLIFLFFAFVGGGGILVYLALWLMLANKNELHDMENEILAKGHHDHHGFGIMGFFFIIVGALFLADNFFPGYGIKTFWPLLLIFFGLALMLRKHRA